MSSERILQLHTAALALAGAVFAAVTHSGAPLPAALAVAAVAAVFVADRLAWLRLNRIAANTLAVVAVAWSLRNFFDLDPDEQLLAIANMLCYLQIVLLFQEKSARVYWQLIVMSVLQVVVAAALDPGPGFSLLLGGFTLIALSALFWLCVYREFHALAEDSPPRRPSSARSAGDDGWAAFFAPPVVSPLDVEPGGARRGLPAGVAWQQTAGLTAVTALFTAVFFYATPRLDHLAWQGGVRSAGAISGFRPEVHIKERGRIHLSNQKVMRVALSRMRDRRAVPFIGDPYFWGAALTDYMHDESGSRWLPGPRLRSQRGQGGYGGYGYGGYAPVSPSLDQMVRQDIARESSGGRRFAIMPFMEPLESSDRPRRSITGSRAPSDERSNWGGNRFTLATPAIANNRQLHGAPADPRYADVNREDRGRLLKFEPEQFPRLAGIAAAAIQQQGLAEANAYEKALALERHFTLPGGYRYSLDLDLPRDAELDPIEDFVANHRAGHCEYFASALALMLRSQGIPARMITGYHGGELNSLGHYFVVQERHAHAWVEALLPADAVPATEIAGSPGEGGVWYRLDPTPGRETYVAADERALTNRVAQAFDYVELMWRDYVLSLNRSRQDEFVFGPMTEQAGHLPAWLDSGAMQRAISRWLRKLGLDMRRFRGARRGRIFEAEMAVAVMLALLLPLALLQAWRWSAQTLRRLFRSAGRGGHRSSGAPAFYRRLESVLARLPLVRANGQTPRELATAAAGELAISDQTRQAASLPAAIVTAYYRVRFGGARLDKNEADGIEQSLATLDEAVPKVRK
jgi:transglutaminase-like putative cysteine protease